MSILTRPSPNTLPAQVQTALDLIARTHGFNPSEVKVLVVDGPQIYIRIPKRASTDFLVSVTESRMSPVHVTVEPEAVDLIIGGFNLTYTKGLEFSTLRGPKRTDRIIEVLNLEGGPQLTTEILESQVDVLEDFEFMGPGPNAGLPSDVDNAPHQKDRLFHLVLLHYKDRATGRGPKTQIDYNLVGHIRGMVIELISGIIVCWSYRHTPNVILSSLTVAPDNVDLLRVVDTDKVIHEFPLTSTVIAPFYDARAGRMFKVGGRVFLSTHKQLFGSKAMFGDVGAKVSFESLYLQGGGLPGDQLFDSSKPFSPFVYIFLVTAKELLQGSRQDIRSPFVINMYVNKMYDPADSNFPPHQIETVIRVPNFAGPTQMTAVVTAPGLRTLDTFSSSIGGRVVPDLVRANQFLETGLFQIDSASRELVAIDGQDPTQLTGQVNVIPTDDTRDFRNYTGQSIIAYHYNADNVIVKAVVITPYSTNWRLLIQHPTNPFNRFRQFISLAERVTSSNLEKDEDFQIFLQMFIATSPYTAAELNRLFDLEGRILYLPSIGAQEFRSLYVGNTPVAKDNRLKLIHANFVLVTPIPFQKQVIGFYDRYIGMQTMVADFLISLYADRMLFGTKLQTLAASNPKVDAWTKRINEIITMAIGSGPKDISQLSKSKINLRDPMAATNNYQSTAVIRNKIADTISREHAKSLYGLYIAARSVSEQETANRSAAAVAMADLDVGSELAREVAVAASAPRPRRTDSPSPSVSASAVKPSPSVSSRRGPNVTPSRSAASGAGGMTALTSL